MSAPDHGSIYEHLMEKVADHAASIQKLCFEAARPKGALDPEIAAAVAAGVAANMTAFVLVSAERSGATPADMADIAIGISKAPLAGLAEMRAACGPVQ